MNRICFGLLLFFSILHSASAQGINYQCRVCPVGKYKSGTTNNECVNCPADTYQDMIGATSPTQCKPCPANSFAPVGSGMQTNCSCGLGYSGDVASYSTGARNLNLQRSCGAGLTGSCDTLHSSRDGGTLSASFAVDLDMGSSSVSAKTVSGTGLFFGFLRPWWQVKFERQAIVQNLEIYNSDALKMSSFSVRVGNVANYALMEQNPLCAQNVMWPAGQTSLQVTCGQALQGQYLYIINGVDTNIVMSNVQVMGYLLPGSEICVACTAGKFKQTTGTAACTNCGAGRASATVAATSAAACVTCLKNTFASAGASACSNCPTQSSTLSAGSTALSFCNCNPGFSPAPSTTNCSAFQELYKTKRPWAHYSAERWNAQAQVLSDASGNNRNTLTVGTRAGITLQRGTDRGSPNEIPFLRGTTADQLRFAENSIPQSFTICSVTRYASEGGVQQRVLTADSLTWWHGHYLGNRGVASYSSKKRFDANGNEIAAAVKNTLEENVGISSNWMVMCSKNGGVTKTNVLVDGVARGESTRSDGDPNEWPGATAQAKIDNMERDRNRNLCINCFQGQESDWDLAQLLIWDMHLTDSEMQTVSTELLRYSMPLASACAVTPGQGCNACPAGTYKVSDENTPCINCGAGKYRLVPAATAESNCIACPANTFSFSASTLKTNCSCNAGYAAPEDGVDCVACAAGSYKTTVGVGTCTNCAANEYSTTPAQVVSTCSSCPLFSKAPAGSNEASDCQCNAGYSGANGQTCLACVQGTYKPSDGPSACTLCGNNTYSPAVAATAASVCVPCQSNSRSLMGSTRPGDCKCLRGYLTNNLGMANATCQMCTAGSYNAQLDATTCSSCGAGFKSSSPGAVSEEECIGCDVNTYSAAGAAQCDSCPINTFAPAKSDQLSDCTCNAGFVSNVLGQNGIACSACQAGKHKALTGASPCIDCLVNRYSTAVAATSDATCLSCTENAVSPVGSSASSQCLCDFGFYLEIPSIPNLARSCGVNFNQACPATMDSFSQWCTPQNVVGCAANGNDGQSNTFIQNAYANPQSSLKDSWWRVDFQRRVIVSGVKTIARDGNQRPANMWITVGDEDAFNSQTNRECARELAVRTDAAATYTCTQPLTGQFMFIQQRGLGVYGFSGLWQFTEFEVTGRAADSTDMCRACTAGTFKDTLGSAACTNCPANHYSGLQQQRSNATCTKCYDNSVSLAGSDSIDDCGCSAGFEFF